MKRQIMEGTAFKNCMLHYEKNICVQYASEEEYMAMTKLKEQQRINMKAIMERERTDRYYEQNQSSSGFLLAYGSDNHHQQLPPILEQSNESGSLAMGAPKENSLLMQSLQLDSS